MASTLGARWRRTVVEPVAEGTSARGGTEGLALVIEDTDSGALRILYTSTSSLYTMNHVVIIKSSFKFFFQFRKDPRHCPSFLNSGGCLADCSASTALSSPSRCSAPRRALREARASGARSSSRLPSDVAARYNCQSKPAAKCCRFPRLFVLSRGPRPCSRSWSGRRDRRAKRRGQNDSCCAVLVRRLQQVTRRIRIEIEHSIRRLEVNFEA